VSVSTRRLRIVGDGGSIPQAEPAVPDPPAEVEPPGDLSDAAREQWDRLLPVLPEPLTPADVPAFVMLCNALAAYQQADEFLTSAGLIITDGGRVVENPALRVRNAQEASVARWSAKFGLTPADRPQRPAPGRRDGGIPHLVEQ